MLIVPLCLPLCLQVSVVQSNTQVPDTPAQAHAGWSQYFACQLPCYSSKCGLLLPCRVKEQAGAVDQKFGVKRKLRNLADDAIRKLPMVRPLACTGTELMFVIHYCSCGTFLPRNFHMPPGGFLSLQIRRQVQSLLWRRNQL